MKIIQATTTIADREVKIRYSITDDGQNIEKIELYSDWFSPSNEPPKWIDVDEFFDLFVQQCFDHYDNLTEDDY